MEMMGKRREGFAEQRLPLDACQGRSCDVSILARFHVAFLDAIPMCHVRIDLLFSPDIEYQGPFHVRSMHGEQWASP